MLEADICLNSSQSSDLSDLTPEVSVVMPCLNEAETLEICISKAKKVLDQHEIAGEIIVADNGSTDGSQEIARGLGARVIAVEQKGYGSALMGGFARARGKFIIMGDSDGSYDFTHIPLFVEKLREGFDLVMGNRFRGGVKPGAMSPLHRYVGNPVLTWLGRLFFQSPCGDFHCGLRAVSKAGYCKLGLRTTGMEFASEMVVKATLLGLSIAEIPTTLSPDGRTRPPHLRSWRDGWRHLRFMLLYSPRWLFLYPGAMLMMAGFLLLLWLLPGSRIIGRLTLDVHTLLFAAMAVLIGFEAVTFAVFTKIFAITEGLMPPDRRLNKLFQYVTLEVGVVLGGLLVVLGLSGAIYGVAIWEVRNFGPLDPTQTLRVIIPAVLAITLGFQIILSSFFLSVLGMARK